MNSIFCQKAQIMMGKHIDSYPLLKIDRILDWQPIEQLLHRQKTRYIRDHRDRPTYPLLPMLKAVLPGQLHSLSYSELERCLVAVWISTFSAVLMMLPYPTTAPSAVSAIGWHKMTPWPGFSN